MINELFQQKEQLLSFEVFPPKKEDDFPNAFSVLDSLSALSPDFISVTYGAGGSKSKKTIDIASYIQNKLQIEALAHLTCVGFKQSDLAQIIEDLKSENISNILALRGDRPQYMTDEVFGNRDFFYAQDMISFLKKESSLQIAGACYPEKHFEAPDFKTDLSHLKQKVDAGADFLISQLFFDNDSFYSFQEQAISAGIDVPICTGIMPITSAKQLGTTVSLSGSSVPKKMADLIATYGDHEEDMRKAGIDYAIEQILDLKKHGVRGIHIYSMNKPKMTAEIVNAIR